MIDIIFWIAYLWVGIGAGWYDYLAIERQWGIKIPKSERLIWAFGYTVGVWVAVGATLMLLEVLL